MSFENDLELAKSFPILELVRECQDALGYTHGCVRPQYETDQKTRCPVHVDGSPSAKAYFRSNSVYCWVCGKTWDPPALYAAHHGIPLGRAIGTLLKRLGVLSVHVSGEDLLEKAKELVSPEPGASADQVDVWLDSIEGWAIENGGLADHLDVVIDAIAVARTAPPELAVPYIRTAVAWAEKVSEVRQMPCPPPPTESSDSRYLMGVS